ncbi:MULTISPECIES: Rieske 2Fe-2S domain-containing protein [Rhodobacterales]|uniref:Rieske (2Fe-2S) protein n=1 Tax=Roseobacter sp. N2S TaxID=2663844 RepID=UPI002864D4C4|nr:MULTISPECIES: Rieske 2Fe-2S domain-containing protein [Rhodobacterales]MDR6264812.1 nitrite reductase/ring-hydroxylating ferredoxin subunit [Roseobacter sp. N2S]
MTLDWTDFPDAPAAGTPLCADNALGRGVTALTLGEFPVLVLKDDGGTRAFVNACPHQFLPLDSRGDVLGADGTRLICTNHDAVFDAQTGQGVSGFGLNCALSPIPLKQRGSDWVIGG